MRVRCLLFLLSYFVCKFQSHRRPRFPCHVNTPPQTILALPSDHSKATPEAERRQPLGWDEGVVFDEVEAFKRESIWGHIFATEERDHEFLQYGESA